MIDAYFHLFYFQFKRLIDINDKFSKTLVDMCNVQQEMEKIIQDHKSTWELDLLCHNEVSTFYHLDWHNSIRF